MLLVMVIFAIVAVVVLAMMANRYAGMLEERERLEKVDPVPTSGPTSDLRSPAPAAPAGR
jgi:hypothetical protein